MKTVLMMTAGLIFTAGSALAAITSTDLVAAYQAQGYTEIEVTTGLTQIKVEAVLNRTKVDATYDISSGVILRQEQERARRSYGTTLVEVKIAAKDFLNSHGEDGRGGADNVGDDHGNHGYGQDDGAGHDANDDHGRNNGHDENGRDGSGHDGSGHGGGSDN